mmetsp:Transcript_75309/g.156889  ORF Transcript_75309/g.156889 Transcript_75309/m.156889 type:complete len:202 (+) Transcript_75309:916-1521(+)
MRLRTLGGTYLPGLGSARSPSEPEPCPSSVGLLLGFRFNRGRSDRSSSRSRRSRPKRGPSSLRPAPPLQSPSLSACVSSFPLLSLRKPPPPEGLSRENQSPWSALEGSSSRRRKPLPPSPLPELRKSFSSALLSKSRPPLPLPLLIKSLPSLWLGRRLALVSTPNFAAAALRLMVTPFFPILKLWFAPDGDGYRQRYQKRG